MIEIPGKAIVFGFLGGKLGTHASRTLMFADLRILLTIIPSSAGIEEYRHAVVDENVTLKQTAVTRIATFRYLQALYGLDQRRILFRALRDLWDFETDSQPLLAMLCALGRDSALRITAGLIENIPPGDVVMPEMLAYELGTHLDGQVNQKTLDKLGRNTASSWSQAGYLSSDRPKRRLKVKATPITTTYALLMDHLCGLGGDLRYGLSWSRLLDLPIHAVYAQAHEASIRGIMEFRQSGGITDLSFRFLLRK